MLQKLRRILQVEQNRNLALSITLSVLIVFLWGYLFRIEDSTPSPATEQIQSQFSEPVEDGRALLLNVDVYSRGDIDILVAAGQVCAELVCGSLSETQASQIVMSHFAEKERLEDRWLNRLGVGTAILSFLVAFSAFRQGRLTDQRSIRNEERLAQFEATMDG